MLIVEHPMSCKVYDSVLTQFGADSQRPARIESLLPSFFVPEEQLP
jgi:hypothetical protein